ncbi:PrpF domain-containing protein [Pseudophaeobacter sp.]|uniref:2-methylaconitate cis-trans isomerase PrpF family protein n=1 Tax=Pseudophaeobacter sp. TaxID=1971739 RepID=UPI0032D91B18
MPLESVPALFMRGGTSKALVFDIKDLPRNRAHWDDIFLAATGSPDPNGRQLDGMGGGVSSLSKVCVVGPSTHDEADIDYTFAQISVTDRSVDYAGNCGNMISAMGPAALILGYAKETGTKASIRIHNTNTSRIITASFPVNNGLLSNKGDFAIEGVAGTAAPIRLDFHLPGGTKTGSLLPSGNPADLLQLPNGRNISASLIDAANPCVFISAEDVGKVGTETPQELAGDLGFLSNMEMIRQAGSFRMGVTPDIAAAKQMQSVPKVAIVAAPTDAKIQSGKVLLGTDVDLVVRMISMQQPHRAVPITGALCLAIACRIDGTIPARLARATLNTLTLSQPSGTIAVDANVRYINNTPVALSGTVLRTARLLFSGLVHH